MLKLAVFIAWNILFIGLFLIFVPVTCEELFTSITRLRESAELVRRSGLKQELDTYLKSQEDKLSKIKEYARELRALSSDELQESKFTILHPLNAYRFIRNHSVVFNETAEKMVKQIESFETESLSTDLVTELKTKHPDNTDLNGTVTGIIRLQNTYDLESIDVIKGDIVGHDSETMTAEECLDFGLIAYGQQDIYFGREWVALALENLSSNLDNQTEVKQKDNFLYKAAMAALNAEDFKFAEKWFSEIRATKGSNGRLEKLSEIVQLRHERKRKKSSLIEMMKLSFKQSNRPLKKGDKKIHDELCQGKDLTSDLPLPFVQNKTHLRCRMEHNNHPYLLLQPVKLEEVATDPYFVLFHDLLNAVQLDKIKDHGKTTMKTSTVMSKSSTNSGKVRSPFRVSQNSFLHLKRFKIYSHIVRTIEAITSLDLQGYEGMQVANYGVGGQYFSHYDYYIELHEKQKKTNRFATLMVYLSDVDAGGATVFPKIHQAVFPEKGKAVFWHNMYRNGTRNPLTLHGGCPVLVGEKWIANQWIHYPEQIWNLPCTLNSNE